MLPITFVTALLWLIAILVVVLVVRLALKWWRGRGPSSPADPAVPDRTPLAATQSTDRGDVPTPSTVSSEHVLVDDGPVVDFEPATAMAATAVRPEYIAKRGGNGEAWRDRQLFSTRDSASNDLPRVRPDDIPTANGDDYTFGSSLTPAFAALLPESDERQATVRSELVNAGYYTPHAYQNLAALRYVGIMLMLVLFGGLLIILPEQFELFALAGLIIGPVLAWSLPRLLIRGRAADRLAEIERGMPDMLDMLNMCVSQGLTLQHALARISREMYDAYPALAEELAIVVEQSRVGSLEQALHNFEKRVDVPEVHSFVALVTQTEKMGTSVSEALVDYSDGMRESLRQRADTKANQATFKLLFPTVLCLMPAVYLFLMGPAIIEFSNFMENGGLDAVTRGGTAVQNLQQIP